MPQEVREYTNTRILKRRESPQLGDDSVSKVIETAEELADSTEGPTSKLIRTAMFPLERSGIGEGGNSPWNTTALPNNPEYEYDLSAPKPDVYLGYPSNQRSRWSYARNNVINHPVARPYMQPARGNTFPFLMVEIKSEPTGGTLYVAENQAAGSGSYSVNALLWLLKEAGLSNSHSVEDKLPLQLLCPTDRPYSTYTGTPQTIAASTCLISSLTRPWSLKTSERAITLSRIL